MPCLHRYSSLLALFTAQVLSAQVIINNLNVADSFVNLSATTNICANTYVWNEAQTQMLACCSSLIDTSEPYVLSARNDLITNLITPAVPTSIAVKISATAPGAQGCNAGGPQLGVPGLTASLATSAGGSGSGIPLGATSADAAQCSFIQVNGSGFGICGQAHKLSATPSPAVLKITKTHSGNFTQGQPGSYTVTVSNTAGAGPTSGLVTVTENVPSGLSLASMGGAGWTCNGNTCTRSDSLTAGSSYPPLTVTVNVAASATSPQVNSVSVSGGGSASASTTDSTVINTAPAPSPGTRIDNLDTADSFLNLLASNNVCVNAYVYDVGSRMLACCSSLVPASQAYYLSGRQDLISNPVTPTTPASILVKLSASQGGTCNPSAPGPFVPSLVSSLAATAGGSGAPFAQVTPTAADLAACAFIQTNGGGFGICRPAHPLTPPVNPASLNISKTHQGSFTQGQTGAIYNVMVSNAPSAGPSSGTVTVTETVPSGLSLVSMAGQGWQCAGNSCTRSDVLNPGLVYPAITVTVNVAGNATSPQVNTVSVSGGSSATATTTDSTVINQQSTGNSGVQIDGLNTADTVATFTPAENMCVHSYVFDLNQQLVACCSSPVTTSQSYYLSARNDLISNPFTPATPASIQLKFSGSAPVAGSCDPANPGAAVPGLTAFLGPAAGVNATALRLVRPDPFDVARCMFIQANGGGFGICRQAHPFSLSNYSLSVGSRQGPVGTRVEVPIQFSASATAPTDFKADLNYDHSQLTFVSARAGESVMNAGKGITSQTLPNQDLRLASSGPANALANGNVAYATFQLGSSLTAGNSTTVGMRNCLVTSGGSLVAAGCAGGTITATGPATLPVLSVIKTHTGNFTQGQSGASYSVTVSNQASNASTTGSVTVTETIPAGLSLVSMSGTGWNCGGTTCSRADALSPGSSYPPITVTVNVASSAASPVVNTVTVSGGGAAAGATANDSTTIIPSGPAITLPSSLVVGVGDQVLLPVGVSVPAPAGGVFVTLSLSDPAVASLNTVNVLIPEGQTVSTRARLTGLANGSVTIQATAFGYASTSTTVQIGSGGSTPPPPGPAPALVIPSNTVLHVGDQILFPVGLTVPAASSGVFITLTSGNTGVAAFNTTNVIIAAGETQSNRVRLTATGPGIATVSAAASGYTTVTQQVQVLP